MGMTQSLLVAGISTCVLASTFGQGTPPMRWRMSRPAIDGGGCAAVYNPHRGMVFVLDGQGVSWEWDGVTWTQIAANGPIPQRGRGLIYDESRRLYISPGYGEAYEYTLDPHTAWYEFDGTAWASYRTPLGPVPRNSPSVFYDPFSRQSLMFGGDYVFRNSPSGHTCLRDEWAYTGEGWAWRPVTPELIERAGADIAADPRRGVLVLFGGGREGFVYHDVWERTSTGNWTFVADNMPTPPGPVRYDARRGNLFSIGVNARWDYHSGAWEQQAVAPVDGLVTYRFIEYDAGRGVGVLFEQDHLVNGLRSTSGAVWELGADGWQQVTPRTPRSRATAEMVWDDARGEAVMFGGYSGGLNRSYALQFDPDPSTWTCRDGVWTEHAVPGPPQRMSFGMTYDARRAVSVVFGGRTPGTETLISTDVWEWDGQAWMRIAAPGPVARSRHAAAYDAARGVTVVFGGQNALAAPLADTWEWNGETWTRRDLLGPTARIRPMMAYDAARRKTVLFGGVTPTNQYQNDTWEYDGVTWTRSNTPGPSPRVGCSMEFDPDRNVVVLWGGNNATTIFQETWEWDGATWTRRDDLPLPALRSYQAAAYDPRRHAMMGFGGNFSYEQPLVLGSLNSELWTLQADCPAPVITREPEPAAACMGGAAEFTIVAEDASSLRYQWRHNMARIDGATGPSLRIESVSPLSAGLYDCLVTRDGDCAAARTISAPATLTVCIADYDCDGFISPFDYAMFVEAFEAGDADLNGDHFVDFFDYDVFVDAFEQGC